MSCKSWMFVFVMLGVLSFCWATVINVNPGDSIQAAIRNASDGDTIQVAAGTYREQIYINKNIVLSGADSATTLIVPPLAAMNQPFLASGRQERPIIGVDSGGTNVIIEKFTIDGEGAANTHARLTGIQFFKASGVIRNNAVKRIRKTPFDGDQTTVGILVNHEFPREYTHSVEIHNNSVYDFGKIGIVCNAPGTQGNVHHNVVIGQGPVGSGFAAQNGIQIGFGATANIAYNNMTALSYTGLSWAAAGILLVASGGNTVVDNNTLIDNQVAIFPSQYSSVYAAGTCNATISSNVINASLSGTGTGYYGILTWSDGGASETRAEKRNLAKPSFFGEEMSVPLSDNNLYPGENRVTMTLTITDNTFTASDEPAGGYGIYFCATENSPQTAAVTDNTISGWAYGIITDKDPGATLNTTANYNNIYDNDYGWYDSTGVTQNAEANWWGHSSGPYHLTLNPTGVGNAVSDNVDFNPWETMVPELIAPSNNTTTNNQRPTFSWQGIPFFADMFNLVVEMPTDIDNIDIEIPASQTEYTPTENLDAGTYTWKVRAKDGAGNWSDFSEAWTLTIAPFPAGWSEAAAMPTNDPPKTVKDGGALVAVPGLTDDGGVLYAFKGWKSGEFKMFDDTAWIDKEPIPFGLKPGTDKIAKKYPGKGAALCWDGANTIYATKGSGTREFWAYDMTVNTWTAKEFVSVPKALKGGTSIAYHAGKVYLLAGGQKVTEQVFYVCDVASDTWVTLSQTGLTNPYNKKWADGSALTYMNGMLYALKGKDKENFLFAYDMTAETWSQKATLPLLYDTSVVAKPKKAKVGDGGAMTNDGTSLYAIKGAGKQDFWTYNPVRDTWNGLQPVPFITPNAKKSTPKTGAGLAYLDGCVYLLKGNKLNEFWRYNVGAAIFDDVTPEIISATTADITTQVKFKLNTTIFSRTINYSIPASGKISLKLYNATGRLVETIHNGYTNAGSYSTTLPKLANGVYFLKYNDGANSADVKIIVQ
ncbi:MAG: T9SS type A sorting domain-containing protein [Candidatus Latescibacteria bacterium]|nr:T9SS type A sorting domain-containing protein [Candidatus Latescibacterota bacterium]